MYVIKGNTQYGFVLMSAVFVSVIFNLFIRREYDFSYILIDINDMVSILSKEKTDIFCSVIINRIKQVFFILLMFKAIGSSRAYSIFMIAGGGLVGLIVSAQLHYLGITGLMIMAGFVLPHYIIYYLGIVYCYRLKLFDNAKESDIKNILSVCVIFTLGIILECFFSTFFLKFFYQYMVN